MIKKILSKFFTFVALRCVGSVTGRVKVNFYSRFTKQTHIGDNCHFNGIIIRGKGTVSIANNFHSGKGGLIITSFHQYDDADAIPYDRLKVIHKSVVISENVWVADRVIILGGVKIGEGAIIQAGAVVVQDVPDCAIVGGNPAKVFKYRNINEYYKLKLGKKFN